MDNQWIIKWTEDLDQILNELPKKHKNLFFHKRKREFTKEIKELKNNIRNYDSYIIINTIAKVIAGFKDAHTMLIIPSSHFIPFEFYFFDDGIYIINTTNELKKYINSKIIEISGISIDEIITELSNIISYENNYFLKSQLPKYLSSADVLFGLEILDSISKVDITLSDINGEIFNISVDTCLKNNLQFDNYSNTQLPLYRRNLDKFYWSDFIDEYNTLYVNYNYCKDMPDIMVKDFCIHLIEFIKNNIVHKLIIDLRNNTGGNSSLFEPFIRELINIDSLNKGKLFVILGRDTFSSALLNAYSLKNKTNAIFIGEGTGGKPNCYGEVQYFELNNSKLKIRYSTQYYKLIKDNNQMSLIPDVVFDVKFKDYIENKDPCMDYILGL